MNYSEILTSFLENYNFTGPTLETMEIDTICRLPYEVSIPELLVFMEARRVMSELDYHSLHVWQEVAENYLGQLTESNFLTSECINYRALPEEVIQDSVMLAGEIETALDDNLSVTIFWPKNTYSVPEFKRDLAVLDNIEGFNGIFPITKAAESPMPNMIMFGDVPISHENILASFPNEITTRYPNIMEHYNMVTYYKDHFYLHLATDLSEIEDVANSITDPSHISIGRLNVLTLEGLTPIDTQHPSSPGLQDAMSPSVEPLTNKAINNELYPIVGYAFITCILLVGIWTGIEIEPSVELLFV